MNNFHHLTQYNIIGITGIIGSGKSYLSQLLKKDFNANIIEIDEVRRNMLWTSLNPNAILLRKNLIRNFNIENFDSNLFFNREKFTDLIFSDIHHLHSFNHLCFPYFLIEIENLIKKEQLNCLVWVNLIEEYYYKLVEHIVLVNLEHLSWIEKNQHQLIQIQQRLDYQNSFDEKVNLLENLNLSYEVWKNE